MEYCIRTPEHFSSSIFLYIRDNGGRILIIPSIGKFSSLKKGMNLIMIQKGDKHICSKKVSHIKEFTSLENNVSSLLRYYD